MSRVLPLLTAVLGLFLAAGAAQAHSTLESSVPADGATVSAPKTILMKFTRDLRLVTVRLTAENFDESLAVDRSAPAAKSFSVPLPALAPGTYTVKWRAAATDGHIMMGSLSFTVAAGSGNSDQSGKP
jgi:methionine-rich copper-binding protein CopC